MLITNTVDLERILIDHQFPLSIYKTKQETLTFYVLNFSDYPTVYL